MWAEDGISATATQNSTSPNPYLITASRPTQLSRVSTPAATSTTEQQAPEGASWTWCYPHHYAPLVSDLANAKLLRVATRQRSQPRDGRHGARGGGDGRMRGEAGEGALSSGPVRISRGGAGGRWASTHGPCRPLLQLASILPPCRCGLAAQAHSLACLIVEFFEKLAHSCHAFWIQSATLG